MFLWNFSEYWHKSAKNKIRSLIGGRLFDAFYINVLFNNEKCPHIASGCATKVTERSLSALHMKAIARIALLYIFFSEKERVREFFCKSAVFSKYKIGKAPRLPRANPRKRAEGSNKCFNRVGHT